MIKRFLLLCAIVTSTFWANFAAAQNDSTTLTVGTVTRAPFSIPDDTNGHAGFSIDLLNAAAAALDIAVTYVRYDSFSAMMQAVQSGETDAAIANISITAERERLLDFTQPIFDGGIQVMLRDTGSGAAGILSVLMTRDVGFLVLAAVILLLVGGMLMWLFERRRQPYFDHSAKDAVFPAFWWALNLVVNGGFEERIPQSRPGRALAVVLVIGSLFIVSIFVAQITAALTVSAIQHNVDNLSDLEGRQVGTIDGSTTSTFLNERGITHRNYPDPDALLAAFEADLIEAVVFDGPILAYYVQSNGGGSKQLFERIYRPEKYGMAFPSGSTARERIDQAILQLREDGIYSELVTKWFGGAYSVR